MIIFIILINLINSTFKKGTINFAYELEKKTKVRWKKLTIAKYHINLLFNEITNLKFPTFLFPGRIITYPPYLQGG